METCLVMVKPDGVSRKLSGEIVTRLEKAGVNFIGMKLARLTAAEARQHYRFHENEAFFPELVEFITSGPVLLIACQGKGVIRRLRSLAGATDPAEAAPGTIRFDFGTSIGNNVVHVSDGPRIGNEEVNFFFGPDELL